MTPAYVRQIYLLFAVFAVILVFASAVGWLLQHKARATSLPIIESLIAYINVWWVMLIVIGTAILLSRMIFIALFTLIALFALREFISLLPTRRDDYLALLISS